MALALAAAMAVVAIIQAWDPPIHWRTGKAPTRYVTARVEFKQENRNETEQARLKAREETKAVFIQDVKPLEQLRHDLRNTIAELTKTETLTEKTLPIWREFLSPGEKAAKESKPPAELPDKAPKEPRPPAELSDKAPKEPKPPTGRSEKAAKEPKPSAEIVAFQEFRKALAGKENLDQLDRAVAEAFAPLEQHGLLAELTEKLKGFNKKTISVYAVENPAERRDIEVSEVTVDPQAIRQKLTEGLSSKAIADRVWAWLEPRLLHPSKPLTTFTRDDPASEAAQKENADNVEPAMIAFRPGDPLVKAGESIDPAKIELLKLENSAFIAQREIRGPLLPSLCGSAGGFRHVHALRDVHALPATRRAGRARSPGRRPQFGRRHRVPGCVPPPTIAGGPSSCP